MGNCCCSATATASADPSVWVWDATTVEEDNARPLLTVRRSREDDRVHVARRGLTISFRRDANDSDVMRLVDEALLDLLAEHGELMLCDNVSVRSGGTRFGAKTACDMKAHARKRVAVLMTLKSVSLGGRV